MAKLKTKNHYLAECYQKGFTDASGRVWVKFTDRPEPEPRNPSSVGWWRRLYIRTQNGKEDDKIENFFATEVETPFAELSRRIKKRTIEEQAGSEVDGNTFLRVMLRKMSALVDDWSRIRRQYNFYTTLPHVGDHFITGDSPVLILQINDNKVWVPTDEPRLEITDLGKILQHPNHQFWMPLSPYVCVCVRGQWEGEPQLPPRTMDPGEARLFNSHIRGQCKNFTLARDRESLI